MGKKINWNLAGILVFAAGLLLALQSPQYQVASGLTNTVVGGVIALIGLILFAQKR